MDLHWIHKARDFAKHAHGSQLRKYTGVPYWHHLEEVAGILLRHSQNPQVVAAGWLHDTLEDTSTTYEQLVAEFDATIAELVLEVTDVSRPEHGKRPMRKRLDRQYLAGASAFGQMIKCADTISNTRDIAEHDHRFAREVYIPEKAALVPVLVNARNLCYPLWRAAFDEVEKAKFELQIAA
ncbi:MULTISPECIES: HD domain-containing protein [unclassified Bradyrhizobium]|uniref:HD domain-containing protein n=1 Tax=unclassified Bradyrhizobium TaxID=2631580 RepID=UPI0028F12168|nr:MULTISPECIES: HD domain-containing protein [unclassified Bradyrhizobium]